MLLTALAVHIPTPALRRSVHAAAMVSSVMLGYAVFIPYLPADIPRWAKVHVAMAASSCVLIMGALLLILLAFRLDGALLLWLGITAVSGILFLTAGMVTSALEVFFTLSTTLLTRSIWLRIDREKEYRL